MLDVEEKKARAKKAHGCRPGVQGKRLESWEAGNFRNKRRLGIVAQFRGQRV